MLPVYSAQNSPIKETSAFTEAKSSLIPPQRLSFFDATEEAHRKSWLAELEETKGFLAKDPANVSLLFKHALLSVLLQHHTEAVEKYNVILELQPKNTQALYSCAIILNSQGNPQEALKYYDKLVALEGNKEERLQTLYSSIKNSLSAQQKSCCECPIL